MLNLELVKFLSSLREWSLYGLKWPYQGTERDGFGLEHFMFLAHFVDRNQS